MTRRWWLAGALLLGACSDTGVQSESATQRARPETTASPSTDTAPSTTDAPTTTASPTTSAAPTTTAPVASTVAPSTTTPSADESAGDSLYPELGTDDLDVQSYVVRITYDPTTAAITGGVTIAAVALGPLDRLVLDSQDLSVSSVIVNGTGEIFETVDRELRIQPSGPVAAGQEVVIEVLYTAQAMSAAGSTRSDDGWFATAGGSFVLNEPDGARTWMPSNDHPSDKATWRFEITVPTGITAVANGELLEQRSDPLIGDTWVWEQREPMTTYLVQVLTGDYEILDAGLVGALPIVNVALAGDVERMAPYFELTDDQLAFFEPLFGPFPLERYGLAFTDSFAGLAMEHQGRSLFSREDFPGGQPGPIEHLLLSHELAHQWFGDAVSPADWSDLWLNESFATYGEWLWLDHAGIFSLEANATTNLTTRQSYLEPTGIPTVDNLFGYERYGGGAVVVHALRLELGDDLFFPLLQRWVADNDGTSRTTADFIALTSEVAGRDLTAFFDAWLFAADVPDEYPA